jgi:predicted AAA+ superfamily ATPase
MLDSFSEAMHPEANLVLLFGKRKVGKTTLIAEHLRRRRGIYLTISNKASQLQLNDISDYLKTIKLSDSFIPTFRTWREFFEYIFSISKEQPLSLAIDEFQNFEKVDPTVYDELKALRERHAKGSKLTIIAVTSGMDFIQRTFSNPASPLYRLQTDSLKLSPFVFSEVARIIQMHDSILPVEEVMKIYIVFGGMPKYYALIDRFELWNKNVHEILRELVFRGICSARL